MSTPESGSWPSSIKGDKKKRGPSVYQEAELVWSALTSLYGEFDKLSKKSPKERVTDLALKNVNDAIVDAKALLGGDRYVDRVTEFIPAGENPQNSDVLLVLSTLQAALERLVDAWKPTWQELNLYWFH
jgi:hypothetical protein